MATFQPRYFLKSMVGLSKDKYLPKSCIGDLLVSLLSILDEISSPIYCILQMIWASIGVPYWFLI